MTEPKAMQEIHAIREQMSRELKGLSPKEQSAYWVRKSKETEESLLKAGYKFISVENSPGHMRMVRTDS